MSAPPLYDPALLERARHPVGAGELAPPRARALAANPLCGDEVVVDVRVDNGHVTALAHRARGCSLSIASASLLAEVVIGASAHEGSALAQQLADALRAGPAIPHRLRALEVVRAFPSRHRCVLLPWEAFLRALAADEAA